MGACGHQLLLAILSLLFLSSSSFKIDGKVLVPPDSGKQLSNDVQILVDGGKYKGFLRSV